jgi:F-box/leucine-rich repeat protein 10/11
MSFSNWTLFGRAPPDVATQSSSQWTLGKWADYVLASSASSSGDKSDASHGNVIARPTVSKPDLKVPAGKVYNIISLEISGTELAKQVKPPRLVRCGEHSLQKLVL